MSRRTKPIIFLLCGVATTLFFFFLVPFSDGTSTGAKIFFSAIMGGFAAFGLWGLSGIPSLIADLWRLATRSRAKPSPIAHRGPLPDLSPGRQADVRRAVRVMAEHGVFAPEIPDPALLYPGIAEMDESVKPDTILAALGEVDYYHTGADAGRYTANLVILDSRTEQTPDYLHDLIDAVVGLTGGALTVSDIAIDAAWPPADGPIPVRIDMTVNGEPLSIAYQGDIKYGSTHIPHALAQRLDAAQYGRRLGWLWTDQGAWISALPDGAVEAMNAALKLIPRSRCRWEWVSDAVPFAAGDSR